MIAVEAGHTGGIFDYNFYVETITVDGVRHCFRDKTKISDAAFQRINTGRILHDNPEKYEQGVKAARNFVKKNKANIERTEAVS